VVSRQAAVVSSQFHSKYYYGTIGLVWAGWAHTGDYKFTRAM